MSGSLAAEAIHSEYPLREGGSGVISDPKAVPGTSVEVTPSFVRLTLFTIEDFKFLKESDKRCFALSVISLSILLRSIASVVSLFDSIAPNLVAFQSLLAAIPP